jgi:hypothetical protein
VAGLTPADIDLIELNEAFAAQVLACTRERKLTAADFGRLNVNGSGISLDTRSCRWCARAGDARQGDGAPGRPLRAGDHVRRWRTGPGRRFQKALTVEGNRFRLTIFCVVVVMFLYRLCQRRVSLLSQGKIAKPWIELRPADGGSVTKPRTRNSSVFRMKRNGNG